MVSIKDDIATCLRMLRARGGALDLKAADFIEAMDSVGTRQQTEIQALGERISALEGTLAGAVDPADDVMHDRLAFMVEEAEARLRTAFKGFVYVNPIAELEELVNAAIGELDRLRSLVLFPRGLPTSPPHAGTYVVRGDKQWFVTYDGVNFGPIVDNAVVTLGTSDEPIGTLSGLGSTHDWLRGDKWTPEEQAAIEQMAANKENKA